MEALFPCLFVGLGLPALLALAVWLESLASARRARELTTLARGLEGGRAVAPTGWLVNDEQCHVSGELDGRTVTARFERRGSGKHKHTVALLTATVHNPAATFDVAEAGLLDRLGHWLGISTNALADEGLVLRDGGAGAVKRLIQAGQVKVALRRVLALDGVSAVALRGTSLTIEQRLVNARIDAARLRRALDALVALATRCDRVPVSSALKVSVRVRPAPTFAWTDGGAEARCPFCRDALDPDSEAVAACERCGTAHHAACIDEAGGCTVFGCGAREPSRARA